MAAHGETKASLQSPGTQHIKKQATSWVPSPCVLCEEELEQKVSQNLLQETSLLALLKMSLEETCPLGAPSSAPAQGAPHTSLSLRVI